MIVRPRFVALLPLCLAAGLCSFAQSPASQATNPPIPHIDHSGTHPTLIVDGAPFLMLGAQVNNSSAFASEMPKIWPVMDELGREHRRGARLLGRNLSRRKASSTTARSICCWRRRGRTMSAWVLLWFGTWKNGSPGYTPAWIKQSQTRYPLSTNAQGKQVFSLSPFGEHTLAADTKAFTALMQHLKTADPQHTVILVQVENESGMWGNSRDHSPAADKAFAEPVPEVVRKAMGKTQTGDWTRVFGPDADEYFSAWAIARYINQVAAAGKAADPLPMYVNAALRDPSGGGPGSFESGAPVYDALPLWHALTPSIDAIAPDIYMPQYDKYMAVIRQYALPWNPFFIPETGNSKIFAHYFFAALGAGGFGWSPFGMDRTGYVNYPLGAAKIDAATLAPFALNYTLVKPMMREIAKLNGEGRVRGVAEPPDVHEQTIHFAPIEGKPAGWTADVAYGLPAFYTTKAPPGNAEPEGEALVAQLGSDEFLVAGVHCRVDFRSTLKGPKQQRMWLSVEEGMYVDGTWKTARLWNGDQTDYGLNFTDVPFVLRVKLTRY